MAFKTEFFIKVIKNIKKIPSGKVATYGQIAALSGKPHGAREVAWILHSCSTLHKLPWHRVLNSQGAISFPRLSSNYQKQRRACVHEGIEFSKNGKIDLKKYQYLGGRTPVVRKNVKTKDKKTPKMFQK
ncbi:MAG: MGMT family protein [Pseudobdellovibrionaceae bacterium]